MKRSDAFLLTMTAFVAANCISYFLRSGAPSATGWGCPDKYGHFYEMIGFPLTMCSVVEGGDFSWLWISWAGNLALALIVSYLATRVAGRLPPLWAGYSRTFRYSLRGLLGTTLILCLLLGMAMVSEAWGLVVRNLICLAAPVAVYCWRVYRKNISWTWLVVAAVGLTLLALAIGLQYEPFMDFGGDPTLKAFLHVIPPEEHGSWDEYAEYRRGYVARSFLGLTVVRAVVPIFGSLSLLVLLHAATPYIKHTVIPYLKQLKFR